MVHVYTVMDIICAVVVPRRNSYAVQQCDKKKMKMMDASAPQDRNEKQSENRTNGKARTVADF